MSLPDLLLLCAAVFGGGVVNSVAGGGSFLAFPMLILSGLSPLQANIMCTIAFWPGAMASAVAYRSQLQIRMRDMKMLALVSLTGSGLGTAILLLAPEAVFESLVPWLLLFATLLLAMGNKLPLAFKKEGRPVGRPSVASQQMRCDAPTNSIGPPPTAGQPASCEMQEHFTEAKQSIPPTPALPLKGGGRFFLGQFLIAIYGGYFGAGIGVLLLAMLQLAGFTHMHQMNALKTCIASVIHAMGVLVFILSGYVVWSLAPLMIVCGIAGGYVGARLALKVKPHWVRRFVVAVGAVMTVYFFTQ